MLFKLREQCPQSLKHKGEVRLLEAIDKVAQPILHLVDSVAEGGTQVGGELNLGIIVKFPGAAAIN